MIQWIVVICLGMSWALSGSVVDEHQKPISGVQVYWNTDTYLGETENDGSFSFTIAESLNTRLLSYSISNQIQEIIIPNSGIYNLNAYSALGESLFKRVLKLTKGKYPIAEIFTKKRGATPVFWRITMAGKPFQMIVNRDDPQKVYLQQTNPNSLLLKKDGFVQQTILVDNAANHLGQITLKWEALKGALLLGDHRRFATETEILDHTYRALSQRDSALIAARARLFDQKPNGESIPNRSLDSLDWWPTASSTLWNDLQGKTLDHTIQVLTTNAVYTEGKTIYEKNLAFLGLEPSPYFVLGGNPIYNASRGDSVNAQMMTFMENVFEWLLGLDSLKGSGSKIALGMMNQGEQSSVENWLLEKTQNSVEVIENCFVQDSLSCLEAKPDLLILASDDVGITDFHGVSAEILKARNQGLAVLYMVRTGNDKTFSKEFNSQVGAKYQWNNYFKHLGLKSFDPNKSNPSHSGLKDLLIVLEHFKNIDYQFDWSLCVDNNCDSVIGLRDEFLNGAQQLQKIVQAYDRDNTKLFDEEGSEIYKLLILLADRFRSEISFPMDKIKTGDTPFLKALFADYGVYLSRSGQETQVDLGNFSRTDFKDIQRHRIQKKMEAKKNFRSAGVYVFPGQQTRIVRKDQSAVQTKVFINTQRPASTKEFEADQYKRPKFLKSVSINLVQGDTLILSSPYGGPLQIEYSENGDSVEFEFDSVGLHPYWQTTADDSLFTARLNANEFDWAEISTPGFEVHSQITKMRESLQNLNNASPATLASLTERYVSNLPHVLAGYKGPGIDSIPEIHKYAESKGLEIAFIDLVKHMNADQPTCGAGCSGNPYDAGWAFNPLGHGDLHELGHGLEKPKFKFSGWESHSHTNYYSYFSKSKYFETTGAAPNCQSLKFEELYTDLQGAIAASDTFGIMNGKDYSTWSFGASVFIQFFMLAESEGVVSDGWYLLSRLHLLERAYGKATKSESEWDFYKGNLGMPSYQFLDLGSVTQNDWLAIALSWAMERNLTEYFRLWGIALSTKAIQQINNFSFPRPTLKFFGANDSDFCLDFQPSLLPLDGVSAWPY